MEGVLYITGRDSTRQRHPKMVSRVEEGNLTQRYLKEKILRRKAIQVISWKKNWKTTHPRIRHCLVLLQHHLILPLHLLVMS